MLAFDAVAPIDLNQIGLSSDPASLTRVGDDVYFVADDGQSGAELYRTDGTAAGTVRVVDLAPGPAGSAPDQLTAVGGDLFFTASDDGGEPDLWKTDGTAGGTIRLIDADNDAVYEIFDLTASGNRVFFSAYEETTGYELWASDGTVGGTGLVTDLNPDALVGSLPSELTDVNGTLFFAAYGGEEDNRELYKSDGTAAGTVLVRDIDGDVFESSDPQNLTAVGNALLFSANGGDGFEPFLSDGTSGGTVQIADIVPGLEGSYPTAFHAAGSTILIVADAGRGTELLSLSGGVVSPVDADAAGNPLESPADFTDFGGDVYFVAGGGTQPGLVVDADPDLTPANSYRRWRRDFVGRVFSTASPSTGRLTHHDTGNHTFELPTLDGFTSTASDAGNDGPGYVSANAGIGDPGIGLTGIVPGDLVIRDLNITSGEVSDATYRWTISDPAGLTGLSFDGFASGNEYDDVAAGEGLVFRLYLNGSSTPAATSTTNGDALDNWFGTRDSGNISLSHPGGSNVTTATVEMTFGVAANENNTPDRNWEALVINASLTASGATSGSVGRELRRFSPAGGASLVADIVPGAGSNPSELTAAGSRLLFTADNPVDGTGRELYRTDGTAAGTTIVTDLRPGTEPTGLALSSSPTELTAIGSDVVFAAAGPGGDVELYVSDGTAASTSRLVDLNPITGDADPEQFVTVGGQTYFVATDGVNGQAIYRMTTAGPVLELDVSASSLDEIDGLAAYGNDLLFVHNTLGVYRHNPGTDVTVQITPQIPTAFNTAGDVFAVTGSRIYFVGSSPAEGIEVWTSTGGTATQAAAVRPGNLGSDPSELTIYGNNLYFAATTTADGRELFRLPVGGSTASLVTDIDPGDGDSDPVFLTTTSDRLYFVADSPTEGIELFSVSGTGPATLIDVWPGDDPRESEPRNLTAVGDTLYFSAIGPANEGRELFKTTGTTAGTVRVADINPGTNSSYPQDFAEIDGTLYFSALSDAGGRELYRTDGTAAGTVVVADLAPGAASSDPIALGALPDGRLVIAADAGAARGREIFVGTEVDGFFASDLEPGSVGSNATDFAVISGRAYVVADDPVTGRELQELIEVIPAVESVALDDGSGQRSMVRSLTVTFDTQVDVDTGAWEIENVGSAANVGFTSSQAVVDGKTVVTLDFVGTTSTAAGGSLADGNYRLTIPDTAATAGGTPLSEDFVHGDQFNDGFFRLLGDVTGNGSVQFNDALAFINAYNSTAGQPGYDDALDFNGDGSILLDDFFLFSPNYNQARPPLA